MTRFAYLDHPGVLAFAHRGGALEAPENTMAAFEYAVGLGYRYVETDVHATRDGQLIAFHDDRLDRVSDGHGLVAGIDFADVARARIAGVHRIPTLADLLGAWPSLRVNIDPKSDAAVEPLIRVLRDMRAQDRVCVGSFSSRRVAKVRAAFDGAICTAMGPRDVLRFKAASYGVPAGRITAACLQVPVSTSGLSFADARMIRTAKLWNKPLHVWTIDTADEMERLLAIGVHGIMTDRPRLLRDVLKKHGLWA